VIPYISQHIDEMKFAHPHVNEKWALNNITNLSYHGLRKKFMRFEKILKLY